MSQAIDQTATNKEKSGIGALILLLIYCIPLLLYAASIIGLLCGFESNIVNIYILWFDGFSRNPEILAELHALILPALAAISGASFIYTRKEMQTALLILAMGAFLSAIFIRGVHSVEFFRKDIAAVLVDQNSTNKISVNDENNNNESTKPEPEREVQRKLEGIVKVTNDMSKNTLLYLALLLGLQSVVSDREVSRDALRANNGGANEHH